MRRSALIILFIAAPVLHALSYSAVVRDGSTVASSTTAMLTARRVDADGEEVRREITIPSSGSLPAREGTWELRIESERLWIAPMYVDAAVSGEVVMETVPAGRLQARLGINNSVGLPEDIGVLLTPAEVQVQGERRQADVRCPVRDREILCTLPAGLWDIRLTAVGFVPQFRWNVRLVADAVTKTEPIPLVKGAAIIGTVERPDKSRLPADTIVKLAPAQVSSQEAQRLVRGVRANAKGFFEFAAVDPGEYSVSASSKGLTSDSRQIVVIANRTAELRAPLVIDTPKSVRATVTPTTDPDGQPWLISLLVARNGMQHYDTAGTGPVAADGVWEQKSLRSGEYLLTVGRRDNAEWASVPFAVGNQDVDLQVSVPAVAVKGTVFYGNQPLSGHVTFGGEYGSRRQVLSIDADGRFAGTIPSSRDEDPWDIFVESDTPPMRRTLVDVKGEHNADDPALQFELVIPRTVVLGSVVRPDGKPVSHAIITILGNGRDSDQVFAADDATFQISGLSSGSYRITAEGFMMTSDVVTYQVRDEDNPDLRLVVRDVQKVEGRVITPAGVPVIGASIAALPGDAAFTGIGFERTNDSGRFLLQLPAGASVMDLLIIPPGFATVLARTPVRPGKFMEVTVDQHGGALSADIPGGGSPVMMRAEGGAIWPFASLARSAHGSVAVSGAREHVTVPGLRPGQYSICIVDRCVTGYVPPHGSLELSLQ